MPSLPVIANHYLVTQRMDDVGHQRHEQVCVLCIHDTTAAASPSQIATKVAAQWAAHIAPIQSNGYTMANTDVLPLDGVSSTVSFATASVGTAGGLGGGQMPPVTAFVVAWQTGLRGKSKRGRSFIPGIAQSQVPDINLNALSGAAVTAVQNAANGFLLGLAAGGAPALNLVVLSRKLGIATLVTNARCDLAIGIQRRRYEKVARH